MTAVREAVARFQDPETFQQAIDDLLVHGFDRADLSLLAGERLIEKALHHAYATTRELEDNPDTPVMAYSSRESMGDVEGAIIGGCAYLGTLLCLVPTLAFGGGVYAAVGMAAAGAFAGAALGVIFARMLAVRQAARVASEIGHGGLLLWVRVPTPEKESRALEILNQHSGADAHIHTLPLRRRIVAPAGPTPSPV